MKAKCKCRYCGWVGMWEETLEDNIGKGICPVCCREEDIEEEE